MGFYCFCYPSLNLAVLPSVHSCLLHCVFLCYPSPHGQLFLPFCSSTSCLPFWQCLSSAVNIFPCLWSFIPSLSPWLWLLHFMSSTVTPQRFLSLGHKLIAKVPADAFMKGQLLVEDQVPFSGPYFLHSSVFIFLCKWTSHSKPPLFLCRWTGHGKPPLFLCKWTGHSKPPFPFESTFYSLVL